MTAWYCPTSRSDRDRNEPCIPCTAVGQLAFLPQNLDLSIKLQGSAECPCPKSLQAAQPRQQQSERITDVLPKLWLRSESGRPLLPVMREAAKSFSTSIATAYDSGSHSSNHSAAAEAKVQGFMARHRRHSVVCHYHRDARQIAFGQLGY